MGIRYFLHGRRYRRLENRGTGKIVAVVTNEKIEEFIGVEETSTLKEIATFLVLGFLGEIWKRFIVTVEKYWNVDYADGEEALENAEMDIYTYTFEKYKAPGYTTGEYTLIGCEF